ncbi:hypothetical protein ACWDTR_20130 [Streptomyces sp. NPDC003470]
MTLPRIYEVLHRERETADTATLTLTPRDTALPPFRPGQFAMVYAFPRGEAPLSLAGAHPADTALTHTVRAVGPVTRALHDLRPGQQVGVRGPYGTPWDLTAGHGRDLLLIAGGLGLAPLRPLLQAALAAPHRHTAITLLIGARTPADLVYRHQYPTWSEQGAPGSQSPWTAPTSTGPERSASSPPSWTACSSAPNAPPPTCAARRS